MYFNIKMNNGGIHDTVRVLNVAIATAMKTFDKFYPPLIFGFTVRMIIGCMAAFLRKITLPERRLPNV
ncbi:hypothetical protein XBJ1_4083 [Xenorhabdus bovienii SS-2004]|uniref:Uncharacterized protein n=1 Tax=Xenorhabdus bovienii (strain SS-2004) TaxID=406818 RepID=D3V6B6_XENBS|nr:hypothetical protein XBJ1_4083 [Xenorhabdus bovienii SS-2004]